MGLVSSGLGGQPLPTQSIVEGHFAPGMKIGKQQTKIK
jgi:hypothetical protein